MRAGHRTAKKALACVAVLFVLTIWLSGCTPDDPMQSSSSPSASALPTPTVYNDLSYVPQAKRLSIPTVSEAGYNIYGTAWIDEDTLLLMTQNSYENQWEYRMFIYQIQSGRTIPVSDEIDNYGWFGKCLSDGTICMYDFNKLILLNRDDYRVKRVVYYPENITISEADISADGTQIAYTDLDDGNLYITDIDFTSTALLVHADMDENGNGRIFTPKWSADGQTVYFEKYGDQGLTIGSADAAGNNESTLFGPQECSSYLMQDGTFFLLGYEGDLTLFDPRSQKTRLLLGGNKYLPIAWDAMGKTAAAVRIDDDSQYDQLILYDLNTLSQRSTWELPKYAPIYFDLQSFSPDGSRLLFLYTGLDDEIECYLLDIE